MPSTSHLAKVEVKREMAHSVRSTEDDDSDSSDEVFTNSSKKSTEKIAELEKLCNKLQKENQRLMEEKAQQRPEQIKVGLIEEPKSVKSEKPTPPKSSEKDETNKKLEVLCKELQKENDRLSKLNNQPTDNRLKDGAMSGMISYTSPRNIR